MRPERDLGALLANLSPQLAEGEYVFVSVDQERLSQLGAQPLATFRETEGISAILARGTADAEQLQYEFVARMIKLGVYSSLDAVGLIAAVSHRLAQAGISVNPVSAYFHDYLFVPSHKAEEAMAALST